MDLQRLSALERACDGSVPYYAVVDICGDLWPGMHAWHAAAIITTNADMLERLGSEAMGVCVLW